jgi:hypothetical protein
MQWNGLKEKRRYIKATNNRTHTDKISKYENNLIEHLNKTQRCRHSKPLKLQVTDAKELKMNYKKTSRRLELERVNSVLTFWMPEDDVKDRNGCEVKGHSQDF